MEDFFYENEFELELKKTLMNNYSIKNPEIYCIMRFMIINNLKLLKQINIDCFVDFILDDNNLPKNIIYKETKISLYNQTKQSVFNILKNWIFEIEKNVSLNEEINYKKYIEKNIKDIYTTSLNNIKKYKKTSYYKDLYLLNCLNYLNELFNINFTKFNKINYIINLDSNKERLEEFLINKINKHSKFDFNKLKVLSEKELEFYIMNNLEKIEPGLKLIQNQFQIKNAYIDILARDINNNHVIIELKIKQDERLLWQSIYYPMQFSKEHPNKKNKIRMITICPKYDSWLLEPLKTIKDIEIFSYDLSFISEGISNITLKKL